MIVAVGFSSMIQCPLSGTTSPCTFVAGAAKAVYDARLSAIAVLALIAAILVWSIGFLADMITRLHLRTRPQRRVGGDERR